MQKLFIGLLFGLLLFSCEEKPVEFPDVEIPVTGKVVLLEDLTGVRCPNCPAASAEIERLAADPLFGDKFIAIGVHGNNLTTPIEGHSQYDFRNEFSIELEDYHRPFLGKPSALINRVLFAGEDFIPSFLISNWESYILQELQREQELEILVNTTFDENTRFLAVDMTVIPFENLTGNFKVSVFLTESHIIDAQERQGTIIEDFEHNHVLRHMLTSYNGDPFGSSMIKDEQIKRSYTYTIPEDGSGLWIPENMEVVIAISKEDSNDRRVLQAAYAHVLE